MRTAQLKVNIKHRDMNFCVLKGTIVFVGEGRQYRQGMPEVKEVYTVVDGKKVWFDAARDELKII